MVQLRIYILIYIHIFLWLREILHTESKRSDNGCILLYNNNNIMFMEIVDILFFVKV